MLNLLTANGEVGHLQRKKMTIEEQQRHTLAHKPTHLSFYDPFGDGSFAVTAGAELYGGGARTDVRDDQIGGSTR